MVARGSCAHVKGPNMARGGVNSLFKNSTNSLEQKVSKNQAKLFALALKGCLQATYPTIIVAMISMHTRTKLHKSK